MASGAEMVFNPFFAENFKYFMPAANRGIEYDAVHTGIARGSDFLSDYYIKFEHK